MSELRLHSVSLRYDSALILDRLTLEIRSGEFLAVLGQSGSGKTTLLNVAAGFTDPSDGRVTIDGRLSMGPSADRAVVFQDDALFLWLNARDNVALPLRLKGISSAERKRRADDLLASVGLRGEGDKPVWMLSGGMRQRVGIARALAADPEFLLMDEPLGALDAMTRDRMQEFLLRAWRRSGTGALMITHSVEEALFLATRVIVLAPRPGRIAESIETSFAARFLAGESARAIKSDSAFITTRERLIGAIHAGDAQEAA